MQLKESALLFDFEETNWIVKKYDDHRYYKPLSGAGLKGVDFIGIFQQKKVVFIEVKNFRAKHPTKKEPFSVLSETNQFITKIADKFEDTFIATTTIKAYLLKKWWYRLFLKFETQLPTSLFLNRDWYFWHMVHQLANDKRKMEFVLWLEIEERISNQGKINLGQHIDNMLEKQLVEFTENITVASITQPIYTSSLKVTLELGE